VLLNKSEDELFQEITSSFKNKITQWNYFVNWQKVLTNIEPIEKELNLLNVLIGKTNLENEFYKLVSAYPAVVKAIPILLAIRANSLEVLIDTKKFIYSNFDFTQPPSSPVEAKLFSDFIINTGLGDLLKDKRLKNLVDYATGVEVGLDSNGRKNRGGSLMESLVEDFVSETCCALNLTYLPQATAKKIKNK
jgi:type II restriction enzyme